MFSSRALLAVLSALALGSCGSDPAGTLDIAVISTGESLFAHGARLSEPAQQLRAATAMGLVTRDAQGEIIPGLADRWIVSDDGLSFIFRLRDGNWPDGSALTAQSARSALRAAMRRLRDTPMELDLAPVEEVRAMAGRVVELRLSGPFPALLQLLAQPELALDPPGGADPGAGDMDLVEDGAVALLTLRRPDLRGLPEDEDWQESVRPLRLAALSAPEALAAFDSGEAEVVMGGTLDSLPLVDTGPLSRGTVRVDPAIGLFGIHVMRDTGPLADEDLREALAMAIDRPALISQFGISGWTPTTRIVNPGLTEDPGYLAERWTGRSIDDLRAAAASRIAAWRAAQETPPEGPLTLTIAIERGPGLDRLYRQLAAQWAMIGIRLQRAEDGGKADLILVDRIARYAAPRWFLDQFSCALKRGLCDEDVDFLVNLAIEEHDLSARSNLLAEAEAELALSNLYIPFGTPLRWSLVRGDVAAFVPNRWAFHPLPPLAEIPK